MDIIARFKEAIVDYCKNEETQHWLEEADQKEVYDCVILGEDPCIGGTGLIFEVDLKTMTLAELFELVENDKVVSVENPHESSRCNYDYCWYKATLVLESGVSIYIRVVDDDASCAGHYMRFTIKEGG